MSIKYNANRGMLRNFLIGGVVDTRVSIVIGEGMRSF